MTFLFIPVSNKQDPKFVYLLWMAVYIRHLRSSRYPNKICLFPVRLPTWALPRIASGPSVPGPCSNLNTGSGRVLSTPPSRVFCFQEACRNSDFVMHFLIFLLEGAKTLEIPVQNPEKINFFRALFFVLVASLYLPRG